MKINLADQTVYPQSFKVHNIVLNMVANLWRRWGRRGGLAVDRRASAVEGRSAYRRVIVSVSLCFACLTRHLSRVREQLCLIRVVTPITSGPASQTCACPHDAQVLRSLSWSSSDCVKVCLSFPSAHLPSAHLPPTSEGWERLIAALAHGSPDVFADTSRFDTSDQFERESRLTSHRCRDALANLAFGDVLERATRLESQEARPGHEA